MSEEIKPPKRRKLPDERVAVTHKFDISGHEGYVTVGFYDHGAPGEIFVVMAKEGSTISGFADAWAQAMSYALQYGVPADLLMEKFSHVRFEPSGMTKNPHVRFAKSVVDYIARWIIGEFLSPEGQQKICRMVEERRREENKLEQNAPPTEVQGEPCSTCGKTKVNGQCPDKCTDARVF